MPRFEVFVPAAPPRLPMDLTLRIDAEHWLAALKTGLQRIGEVQTASNVLCDIQADGSIHVTDADGGRVFRIQELPQPIATAPPPAPPVTPAAMSTPPGRPPPVAPIALRPLAAEPAAPGRPTTSPGAPAAAAAHQLHATAPAAAPAPPPAAPMAQPSRPPPAAAAPRPGTVAGRSPQQTPPPVAPRVAPRPSSAVDRVEVAPSPSAPHPRPIGRITQRIRAEDRLADLFLEVAALDGMAATAEGLGFLLDLAMRTVGCEAGTVFTADLGSQSLSFTVVRGPTATELSSLGLEVPIGVGLVGFCAQENVCVAVSDAPRDPRFYAAVSEAVGYETRSILCAPIALEGRVLGAMELVNKGGGAAFGEDDLAALAYLAAQAARYMGRRG